MIKSKFNSKVDEFLRNTDNRKQNALDRIGEVGLKNIKDETPVDTGELQKANNFKAVRNTIAWYNIKHYAPWVELGTYKMHANPFMRRGINKSKREFVEILKKELSI